ncbi:hypothetical protein [Streptosporangium canum]|uniref:hypothetical protein n=1 Tax=Streptosporangium canum TaxID=324952 RepID=UPI00378AA821
MEVNGLPVPGAVQRCDDLVAEYAPVWPSARETVRALAKPPERPRTAQARAFAQISRESTESRGGSSAVLDLT